MQRTHDLVVFGATSFVGQILCRHLVERHGTDGDVTWAIAGRNAEKLDQVAADTGADVTRIVADADDEAAIAAMVASAKVIISTVGPYALYGSKLVAAVAEAGVGYVDLTGEPQWQREMIDAHHARATETGARIVHACGFDSIPSDLGVWFLQQQAIERFGAPCNRVRFGLETAKGAASGGTIASMMNVLDDVKADPSLRKVLANPYALTPEDGRQGPQEPGPKQPNVTTPVRDDGLGGWQAAFVMAGTNTKVVFRSHALLGYPWGDDFTYGETMMMGDGITGRAKALGMTGALGGFMGAAAVGPLRKVLGKVLPEPGEGPSTEQQESGFFDIRIHGTTADGEELTIRVTGDRDPGYGSTAKMLAESAFVLLQRGDDVSGGFHTPATALGDAGIAALVEHAGLTFDVC
ncbi:MAG: saccharopine dehydrogenase NADP-binding domain-containing protein [Actinomycetota bacterium]